MIRAYLLALLDRVARTAIQVAAGYLVTAHTVGSVDWRTILLATALTVVVSVLQGLVDFPALPGGWIGDVAARALRTFSATAVGSIGASVLVTQVPWATVLTAATLAAATSVVTSSIATPLGSEAVKGTPNLVSLGTSSTGHAYQGYVGYTDVPRHLRTPTYRTSSVVAGAAAGLVLAGMAVAGVTAAHTTQVRVVAVPALSPTAPASRLPLVTPPTSPDRIPAFLAALQRNGISTADDRQALLLLASSVCTYRLTTSDAALTYKIVGVFPGRWTHAQAALIVDAAVDSYCV